MGELSVGAAMRYKLLTTWCRTAHLLLFIMAIRAAMNTHSVKRQQGKMGEEELQEGQFPAS